MPIEIRQQLSPEQRYLSYLIKYKVEPYRLVRIGYVYQSSAADDGNGLWLSLFPDRGIVLVSKQYVDQEQQDPVCHYCQGRLPDCRVLGGERGDPKHFCSLHCYDKWACAPVGRRAALS